MRKYIVIAANITMAQALPVAYTDLVMEKMDAWRRERVEVVVPTLWTYEVVAGVKQAVDRGYLTMPESFLAVDAILSLGYRTVQPTVELAQMALAWSGILGAARMNDGQYLALAETLEAEFWTADEELVALVRQEGASWAHWIESAMYPPEKVNGKSDADSSRSLEKPNE